MSEPMTRAIEQLAERGDARGADRVLLDAIATPAPRARRRVPLAIAASFVAVVVLGTALAVRSRSGELTPVVPVAAPGSVHESLAGSMFAVESVTIDGATVAPDPPVTASFDTEFVRFVAACGAASEIGYRLEGDRFVWSDDPWFAGSGTHSVSDPCASTTVELLRTTLWNGNVELQGDRIVLRNAGNGASTTLRRVGPTPQPPMLGSRWWLWHASRTATSSALGCGRAGDAPCIGLEAQFGDPDMTDEQPSVVLSQSGATLDIECASGPTSASWSGERVELGAPATEPGCGPNAGVELWLLGALPGAFTVRLDGQHLTLLADDGTTLFFHTNAG